MADGIHIDDLIVVLRQNGRMAAEWRMEWSNGGNGQNGGNGGQNGRSIEAEWKNGGRMADGIVKWWEQLNGGNGRRNGQMADRNGYIRTIYGTHRHRRQRRQLLNLV